MTTLATLALATAVLTTGTLQWTHDSVDMLRFDLSSDGPTTFNVLAWGDEDGQHLIPTFEILDAAGEVVIAEESRRCGIGWGGCLFGTAEATPGRYTFYGYLEGFPYTTHNTYTWTITAMQEGATLTVPQTARPLALSVPEPSTYASMLAGIALLLAYCYRRRQRE